MAFFKSILKELQNETQHDYAMALNSCRIHLFFQNRNPDNRGICNHNRHFKNRNWNSVCTNIWNIFFLDMIRKVLCMTAMWVYSLSFGVLGMIFGAIPPSVEQIMLGGLKTHHTLEGVFGYYFLDFVSTSHLLMSLN